MSLQSRGDELLTPGEVATLLCVAPTTVTRWAESGRLNSVRTPGGHRRYLKRDVLAIMNGGHPEQERARVPAPRFADELALTVPDDVAKASTTALMTAAAATEAANVAATAAVRTRRARARAAEQAAKAVAREAARTARRVQIRADVAAAQVKHIAEIALEGLSSDSMSSDHHLAGRAATAFADSVEAAALVTAQDTALAAWVVASAVTAAAAEVARTVQFADESFALEVAQTALVLRELTTATAERVAVESQAGTAGVAAVTAQAAQAT